MKSYEFILSTKEDLKPFHDLLYEEGHPGYKTVAWLIENKKWPAQHFQRVGEWSWNIRLRHRNSGGREQLPWGTLPGVGTKFFFTATQAVWAIIIANLYKE